MIYFVELTTNEYIKIGYSGEHMFARVTAHRREWGKVRFLGWRNGTFQDEKEVHNKFDSVRVKGEKEIFNDCQLIREYIKNNTIRTHPENIGYEGVELNAIEMSLLHQIEAKDLHILRLERELLHFSGLRNVNRF